jgi:two-component system, chemotaxis family, CheB/CheR fusion protein
VSATVEDPAFEALLDFLARARGFDFTSYKRVSLERRTRRRMDAVGCESFSDYLDFLEVHPDEFEQLFNELLINVTEFFRDPPAWEHLRTDALPLLLERKPADEPIRVWSAGCSSGQEAYTVAIVLAELLGVDVYGERVKVYATDVDEQALDQARRATYTADETEGVPPDLRERYFEKNDQRYAFRTDLRRTVIFGRNNLVSDAPISRLDLLICRNTLMYLTAEAQARILRHFHFALADPGLLMLGKSEMMVSHRDLFTAIDVRRRLFRKLPRSESVASRVAGVATGRVQPQEARDGADRQVRDAALELGPQPQVIVLRSGEMSFANLAARALFRISADDLGRPFGEVELAHAPAELVETVDEVLRKHRRLTLADVTYRPPRGEQRRFDITVTPLLSSDNTATGVVITFEDITRYARMQGELEGNRRDLELAYEELQSTIDELETTNEELQSANEELQTTNEELQSTNEELETMNAELQSTNEELETINDELRERTGELNQVNEFLEAILTSLHVGVAVLDRDQHVQVWNRQAQELWGLRQDEAVAHHFLSLDIGLPSERLAAPLRAVLSGNSERERVTLEAVNRRGRTIECSTTLIGLVSGADGASAINGAIVLMEHDPDGG